MAHIYSFVATQNVLHNLHISYTESGLIAATRLLILIMLATLKRVVIGLRNKQK